MFVITYTTNLDDRHKVTMTGKDKTDAYLNFVRAYPAHYIITDMKAKRGKRNV
jgi:hypothetical protein